MQAFRNSAQRVRSYPPYCEVIYSVLRLRMVHNTVTGGLFNMGRSKNIGLCMIVEIVQSDPFPKAVMRFVKYPASHLTPLCRTAWSVNLSAPVVIQIQSHINSLSQPIYQLRFTWSHVLLTVRLYVEWCPTLPTHIHIRSRS